MTLLQKFLKNWNVLVTVIGVVLVFGIVFSGVDAMYILLILGAMNCLYGLYSILTRKAPSPKNELIPRKNSEQYNLGMGICQIIMGVFVFAMGIIYINEIVTGKYFWDIILIGMIILLIGWFVIKNKSRNV